MGLQQPPKQEKPGRLFIKMVMLLALVAGAGVLVWAFSVDSRIDLTEDLTVASLELDPGTFVTVDDLDIRVVDLSVGDLPVVLIHDVDVAGGVVFDQLAPLLEGDLRAVTLDLPGFGLSERMPTEGVHHTVGAMAGVVADVIAQRYGAPVVIVGVGLGGEVGAEVAVTRPETVAGLVMVDVDFWSIDGWRERLQRWPIIGRPMTFTFETSGSRALDTWAPHCDEGGWCPTADQVRKRGVTATIIDSTDSIKAFRETRQASFVPTDLDRITAPVAYVWSIKGRVPRESVERIKEELPDMTIFDVDTWMAHVEMPDEVVGAIRSISG
jgi:pimeloyl-ACP methyl ester carboxylesterase